MAEVFEQSPPIFTASSAIVEHYARWLKCLNNHHQFSPPPPPLSPYPEEEKEKSSRQHHSSVFIERQ